MKWIDRIKTAFLIVFQAVYAVSIYYACILMVIFGMLGLLLRWLIRHIRPSPRG